MLRRLENVMVSEPYPRFAGSLYRHPHLIMESDILAYAKEVRMRDADGTPGACAGSSGRRLIAF